jgi:hypothetical protein
MYIHVPVADFCMMNILLSIHCDLLSPAYLKGAIDDKWCIGA